VRKGIEVVLDEGTQYQVQDLARRQSRSLANATAFLVKLGLEQVRAEQRRDTDHHDIARR
jgi:hypothetical protein